MLIGTNLRKEAPLINSRIRKNWLNNKKLGIALIGKQIDLTYPYEYLGNSPNALVDLLRGRSQIYERLINAKKPMLILGEGAIARKNGLEIHDTAKQIAEKFNMIQDNWNGFNFLPSGIARTSALDFGLYPKQEESRIGRILNSIEKGKIKLIFLLSADELSTELLKEKKDLFVIYQGSHGDSGAKCADVILPGCAYTEKDSIYVNLEGRVQFAKRAAHPPGKAMIDWEIINNLSKYVGSDLGFNNVQTLLLGLDGSIRFNNLVLSGGIVYTKFQSNIFDIGEERVSHESNNFNSSEKNELNTINNLIDVNMDHLSIKVGISYKF